MGILLAQGFAGVELEMSTNELEESDFPIPLSEKTWDLDRAEGDFVNNLKASHTEPLADPLLDVPDDLKRNLPIFGSGESGHGHDQAGVSLAF